MSGVANIYGSPCPPPGIGRCDGLAECPESGEYAPKCGAGQSVAAEILPRDKGSQNERDGMAEHAGGIGSIARTVAFVSATALEQC